MNRFVCTAALGLALAALAAVPARAQPPDALPAPVAVPKNSQIDIDYVLPREAKHRPIYDKLRQHRVLETLQEFLAPLRLPRRLTFKVDECGGAMRRAYQPGSPVTICYEYIALIENNAPGGRNARIGPNNITKDLLIAGAFVHLALHELARAAFDILQIPVWGNEEDAADNVAGVIMVAFGEEVAVITLLGASWMLAQRGFWGTADFTDVVRSAEAQRFYNVLCVAYGADSAKFAFLVKNNDLPRYRAERCTQDFRKLRASFRQAIMPHIDPDLLKQVQAQKWAERLRLQPN